MVYVLRYIVCKIHISIVCKMILKSEGERFQLSHSKAVQGHNCIADESI